jgi:predicted permease
LTCSGLLVRSLLRMTNVDAGFDHTRALLAEFELPMSRYPTDAALLSYWDAALGRFLALPGVEAAGISRAAPLESFIPAGVIFLDGEEREAYASYGLASAGYFTALDIPLLQGRLFDTGDSVDSPHVAVINQAAAEAFWPGADPLGRTVRWAGMDIYSDVPLRVVGVVGNAREQSLTTDPAPTVYSNFFQRPARARDADVLIRATRPGGLVPAVRKELEAMDPTLRFRFQTLSESHSEALAKPRFGASLVTFFAACATLLSSLGLFSSMAYAVSRRTRELGVRMALGAAPRDVRRQVLREALLIAAAGGGIGCVLAAAASRILATQLFGVSATDPATFGAASGLMLLTALVAGWAPAHAASRIDPIEALRQD